MKYVADLHLHSPYSRAVSPQMTLSTMARLANEKGIDLLSAGDWTHPKWITEITELLKESEDGVYTLGEGTTAEKTVNFILGTEISSIYKQGDKLRRIHNLIFVPSFTAAEKITAELRKRGCNLNADGRPIVGLSSRDLLELVLSCDDRAFLIPAHVWTPHFGVYGTASGFDSLEEAFGDLAGYIYGIETGLSSDPEMNWQIPELQKRSILSFSDAHSPAKMARELTFLELEKVTFSHVKAAIDRSSKAHASNYVVSTLEFYPEEGKYHYSGHRLCKVSRGPQEIRVDGNICPVCKRRLTEGVFFRLQQMAGKEDLSQAEKEVNDVGLAVYHDPSGIHPSYSRVVPLLEIIAESFGFGVGSKKVQRAYQESITKVGTELDILLKIPLTILSQRLDERIVEGIAKVRSGDIAITPGFDGEYGKVKIWSDEEREAETSSSPQLTFEL